MSVIVSRGSNPWGAFGSLLGGLGALTGNPMLTAAGAGIGAVNSAMSGNTGGAIEQLSQAISNIGWENPADGNIAKQSPETDAWVQAMIQKQRQNYGYGQW